MISIIVPVYNEEINIDSFINNLIRKVKNDPVNFELIFVDGGSKDNTFNKLKKLKLKYNQINNVYKLPKNCKPCRAVQMNLGADKAKGDIFLFLHIDTILCDNALSMIKNAIDKGKSGGAFNIQFEPKNFKMKIVELLDRFIIFTYRCFFGDQAIFTTKEFFKSINGYPEVALMEDLIMSDKIRKSKKMIIFKTPVTTSSRRFYKNGIIKQMALNTFLFNAFKLNMSPDTIRKLYEKF